MNATRTEPTISSLDNLGLDQEPTALIREAESLLNANADLANENLRTARQKRHAADVQKAEAEYAKALLSVKTAAEALAKAAEARAALAQGAVDYLRNDAGAGEKQMKASADLWKHAKARMVDIGFALAELPTQTWDRLCSRVNNSITQAVEKAGNNVQARKDSIKAWADRVETSIENTVDRITAIPGQIRDYMVAKKVAAKEAATDVLVRVLRWGAQKEEAIRNTVSHGVSLGEAALKTVGDVAKGVVRGVVDPVKQAGETFKENASQAQQRRRTP